MTDGGGTNKGPIKFYTAIIAFFLSFSFLKKKNFYCYIIAFFKYNILFA